MRWGWMLVLVGCVEDAEPQPTAVTEAPRVEVYDFDCENPDPNGRVYTVGGAVDLEGVPSIYQVETCSIPEGADLEVCQREGYWMEVQSNAVGISVSEYLCGQNLTALRLHVIR